MVNARGGEKCPEVLDVGAVGVVAGQQTRCGYLTVGGRNNKRIKTKRKSDLDVGDDVVIQQTEIKRNFLSFFVFRGAAKQSVPRFRKGSCEKNPVRRLTMADKQSIKPAPNFFLFFLLLLLVRILSGLECFIVFRHGAKI
jgi:hypothetical protein